MKIGLTLLLLTLAFAASATNETDATPTLSVETLSLVGTGSWRDVRVRLQKQSAADDPTLRRMLLAHADIAMNNNQWAAHRLANVSTLDRAAWHAWAQDFHAAHPQSSRANYLLGDALARQGQLDDAIDYFEQALTQDPNNALARNARGVAQASRAEYDAALVDFANLQLLAPEFLDAKANHGNLNIRRSLGAAGALRNFDAVLAVTPDFFLAQIGRASALFGLGRWEQALEVLDQLEADPDHNFLLAWNATLIRERIRLAALDTANLAKAGVAIEAYAREQGASLQRLNRDMFNNRMKQIGHQFAADTVSDLARVTRNVGRVMAAVHARSKGDLGKALIYASDIATDFATGATSMAKDYRSIAIAQRQQFNHRMRNLQHAHKTAPAGGVASEDIRLSRKDLDQWGLHARFTLQYPSVDSFAGPANSTASAEVTSAEESIR